MTFKAPLNQTLINIYACGGTGYRIASQFLEMTKDNVLLKDLLKIHFVDTSTSNDTGHNTEENTYVIGDGKGSGKKRSLNANEIIAAVPAVLQKHRPGVFNILVGSASGGTGSRIINELQKNLANRKELFVMFMTGSQSSVLDITNTNNTLTSAYRMAKSTGVPALMQYRQATRETSYAAICDQITGNLAFLCLLLSGNDDKMDISDLTHVIRYNLVTSYAPSLVGFELYLDTVKVPSHSTVYAAAVLGKPGEPTTLDITPEYHVGGNLTGPAAEVASEVKTMTWAVLGNHFAPLMNSLNEQVIAFKREAEAHQQAELVAADKYADFGDDIID